MKYLKLVSATIILTSLFFSSIQAQGNNDKSGTTVAQFLKIGVGAKPMGMGGAYVAQSSDVYSMYWNPSSLTKVQQISFSATHTNWFADITHNFIGFVLPLDEDNAIGIYAIFLDMDPIQITTINEPHGTGEFYEANDLALGVSYATRPVEFLSLGISGKFIQQTIYNESASTFAFDFSSILDIPYKGLKLGMNFSNIGGKMKLAGRDLIREFDLNPGNTLNAGVETRLSTQEWDLPVNFRVGLAMDLIGKDEAGFSQDETNRLTVAIDGNHPSDAAEYMSFGLEYAFNELVMIRGGYQLNRDVEDLFYGVGLNASLAGGTSFHFDYALASFGELNYIHIFSATVSIE